MVKPLRRRRLRFAYAIARIVKKFKSLTVWGQAEAFIKVNSQPLPSQFYGGVQCDARDNHRIGSTGNAKVSYRFRATTTSTVASIRVQERGYGGGTTYSGGTGGIIKCAIQADNNGIPSGIDLCSLQWAPGNPTGNWEVWPEHTFLNGATLIAGNIYHLVFTNVDSNPTSNYISVNGLYWFNQGSNPSGRVQPIFENIFATLQRTNTTNWSVTGNTTSTFDLKYTNGKHDGNNYIGAMVANWRSISGSNNMVRERFTASQNRIVKYIAVKIKRISGNSNLTITVKEGSTTLVSGIIPSSSIILGGYPTVAADWVWQYGNKTWVSIPTPNLIFQSGHTYDIILSTDIGTEYIAVGIQQGNSKGMLSPNFGGMAQYTINGGTSWSGMYAYDKCDLEFYYST